MAKVVSIVSKKGGSGKTSLSMLLASGAISLGKKVHLLDGDRNLQLHLWRKKVESVDWGQLAPPIWPDSITSETLGEDVNAIFSQIEAKSASCEMILIDTRPGTYEDTEDIAAMSDVVLVPCALKTAEVALAIETVDWMNGLPDMFPDQEEFPSVRLLYNNLSPAAAKAFESSDPDHLTDAEYTSLLQLQGYAAIEKTVPNSRIIENMPLMGPLKSHYDARPAQRGNISRVMSVAKAVVEEVLTVEEQK